MVNILYVINARIPTEKAYGVQVTHTCEALAKHGGNVTLILPRVINNIGDNLYSFYKINKNFKCKYIPVIDFTKILPYKPVFFFRDITFYIFLNFYLIYK